MPVKTRSQSRNQWQAKLPAPIRKPKQRQVITLPAPAPAPEPVPAPEPDHLPITTYLTFTQRLDIMLDKIEEIKILRSKSLPDTSLNRTLRFERIRLMSEMYFFIYIYFPSVYVDSVEHNHHARIILDSIVKLKNDLITIKSLDNLTPLENSTINTIEVALISCNRILDLTL
jgi:hypothetical protein